MQLLRQEKQTMRMISSFLSLCVAGVVVAFAAGSLTFAEGTENSNNDHQRYYAPKQVRLTFGNASLNIGVADDGTSLVVWPDGSKTPTRIGPTVESQTGQRVIVTDFVAQGFEYEGGRVGVAIGFATLDEAKGKLEYQFAWGLGSPEQLKQRHGWVHSGPLLTTDADDPFHSMSVSISHGDSVTMSIQRMKRRGQTKSDKAEIESHVFVNNCPVAMTSSFVKETTLHYTTVLVDTEDTPGFLHVPNKKDD